MDVENSQRKEDRRRAVRVPLKVALEIEGVDFAGNPFKETATTVDVSLTGACICTTVRVAPGAILKVSGVKFRFSAIVSVRGVWMDESDGVQKMGVMFLERDDNWVVK